jgi:hypothetical protein
MPYPKLDLSKGKTCPRCQQLKPMTEYSKGKSSTGYQTYCKPCMSARHDEYRRKNLAKIAEKQRERYAKNTERYKDYDRKARYGLAAGEFAKLLELQKGRCLICKTDTPGGKGNSFVVDHCHSSEKVRGLLCCSCNMGLGQFKHNVELLQSAINYLAESC